MFKIMLCCSAGMSTSLLVSKMIDVAKRTGLPVKIDAYGVSEFDTQFPHYQVVPSRTASEIHVKDALRQGSDARHSGAAHRHDGLRHAAWR